MNILESDSLFEDNQEFLDRVEFSSRTLDLVEVADSYAERDQIDFLFDLNY